MLINGVLHSKHHHYLENELKQKRCEYVLENSEQKNYKGEKLQTAD